MHARELLYEAALHGVRPLLGLAAPFHSKLGRGLAGRREAAARLEAWAAVSREPGRPLVWLHAPSVGEGLMAQAIIAELRERCPELQVAFTYFSPSAERLAGRMGADVCGYLPWDMRGEVRRALAALSPDVVAFVRTEIWPVLAQEAGVLGARVALVNAVLAADSSRLGAGSRFLLAPAYGRLHAVGAVADADAGRFPRLGVPAALIRVTGDARFDQVWARVHPGALPDAATPPIPSPPERRGDAANVGETLAASPPRRVAASGPRPGPGVEEGTARILGRLRDPAVTTVVAGSTWPADEARLVPALALVRKKAPFRLIVAPHEPSEAHLSGVERTLDAAGLRHARLAEVEASEGPVPEVVVIDRVGVLADSYAVAHVAYVGGGFGSAGLHSVVEPAALGVPVLFGPRHGNAREADELTWAGGGSVVRDVEGIASKLGILAVDSVARAEAGAAAFCYVRSRLGGAARNAELLLELLGRSSASARTG